MSTGLRPAQRFLLILSVVVLAMALGVMAMAGKDHLAETLKIFADAELTIGLMLIGEEVISKFQ